MISDKPDRNKICPECNEPMQYEVYINHGEMIGQNKNDIMHMKHHHRYICSNCKNKIEID